MGQGNPCGRRQPDVSESGGAERLGPSGRRARRAQRDLTDSRGGSVAPDLELDSLCCGRGVCAGGLRWLWFVASPHVECDRNGVIDAADRDLRAFDYRHGCHAAAGCQARGSQADCGAAGGDAARVVRLDAGGGGRRTDSGVDLARDGVSRVGVHDHAAALRPGVGHAGATRGQLATGWTGLALRRRDWVPRSAGLWSRRSIARFRRAMARAGLRKAVGSAGPCAAARRQ